jgi:YHS domain-containing protein
MRTFKAIHLGMMRSLSVFALAMVIGGSFLASAANAQSEPVNDTGLVQVETKYVCMINNQHFDKEQIAVQVQGQTYYGCCEMCKDKLKNDPKSRMAVDPVSGKKVDKAKAVIGATPDGKVFYFESVANMKKYKPQPSSSDDKHGMKHKGSK